MEVQFRLRSDVNFSPVRNNHEVRYVVEDTASGKILKIGSDEYAICSQFATPKSIQKGLATLSASVLPEQAFDAVKLQKLAGWIVQSGLLEPAIPDSPKSLASTAAKQPATPSAPKSNTPQPVTAPKKLFDPSFFRVKVFSARTLERICRPVQFLLSWPVLACVVWLWIAAVAYAVQNWNELQSIGGKLFVPGSQWWWLIAWFVLKAVHEFGHAVACTRVGVRTSGSGIGFLFFAPTPFVDVTKVWNVENKWSRILVSAAGMLFEMTLASIAVIVACWTDNSSLKYLGVSIATLGTFTTLAFNANPLMRYDGYYIAIDLFGRPNLWQDATRSLKTLVAGLLFKDTPIPHVSIPLTLYGLASWCSRMLVLITMGWGVFIAWDGIGLLVVMFFVCLWYIAPRWMRRKQPVSPSTASGFWRSLSLPKAGRASAVLACTVCLGFLPSPVHIYWPGVVDYVDPQEVHSTVPGFVIAVYVHDGQGVNEGDPIVQLTNPDLELEYQSAHTAFQLSVEKCSSLRSERKFTELQNEESLQESLRVKFESLRSKVDALCVRASRDGVLIARGSHHWLGNFVQEGGSLGLIADPAQVEVKASIPQNEWEDISQRSGKPLLVSLPGGESHQGRLLQSLPRTQDSLESPALAALYGGPLVVNKEKTSNGEEKLKTTQPRLIARIELPYTNDSAGRHETTPPVGAICCVRFESEAKSIWSMVLRWGKSLIDKKLPANTKST